MAPSRRQLLLPPVFAALDGWLTDPAGAHELARQVTGLARQLGVELDGLRIEAPPLPTLRLGADGPGDDEPVTLRQPGGDDVIGFARMSGPADAVDELARALELVFADGRARLRASRAERQLAALDQAVRGIGGVLDIDRVLQLIVDRVRELVDARYAALGIVGGDGIIERFITSGVTVEERRRIGDLPHGRGLLGLIIRENRTFRIPEIAAHPESHGFPPNHPPMRSFLGTPITTQRETVGRLYLTDKIGNAEFSEQDAALVEMFARHAGIAIENARLHDQVRRLAVVDERERISRDLHDSAIQAIYAQTLALDDVPDLIADEPEEARRRVDESIDALHAVIRDIRNFIFGLRPVLLESGNVADGLQHLATELHRNGGVQVEVAVDDPERQLGALPLEVVAEILAVVREGLSNVARHAGATTTRIELSARGAELQLEMVDDGRGFRAEERPDRGHHGLANMRARVEALSGRFEVDSTPGRGTRIIIELPQSRRGQDGGRHR